MICRVGAEARHSESKSKRKTVRERERERGRDRRMTDDGLLTPDAAAAAMGALTVRLANPEIRLRRCARSSCAR